MISNCTSPWCEVFFSLFLSNLRAKNKDDTGIFRDLPYVVHVSVPVNKNAVIGIFKILPDGWCKSRCVCTRKELMDVRKC
jgi:hypothetical protein